MLQKFWIYRIQVYQIWLIFGAKWLKLRIKIGSKEGSRTVEGSNWLKFLDRYNISKTEKFKMTIFDANLSISIQNWLLLITNWPSFIQNCTLLIQNCTFLITSCPFLFKLTIFDSELTVFIQKWSYFIQNRPFRIQNWWFLFENESFSTLLGSLSFYKISCAPYFVCLYYLFMFLMFFIGNKKTKMLYNNVRSGP